MPPHYHGKGKGKGGPGPFGAFLVGGMIGAAVGRGHRHPPPERYYRGRRYRQVIVINQVPQGMAPLGPNEILVSVTCPIGGRPGDPLEIEVDGQAYSVVIPQVREAEPFYARVRKTTASTTAQQTVHQAEGVRSQHQATATVAESVTPGQSTSNLPTADVVESSAAPQAHAHVVGSLPPLPPSSTESSPEAVSSSTSSVASSTSLNDTTTANNSDSFSANNPFMEEEETEDWVISPFKEEFNQFFVACGASQKNNKLVLSPTQVRDALLPTGLPKEVLRNVWELSDIDKDGALDSDEFCVAMYLCRESQAGRTIPIQLPPNVVPPSKRNPF